MDSVEFDRRPDHRRSRRPSRVLTEELRDYSALVQPIYNVDYNY